MHTDMLKQVKLMSNTDLQTFSFSVASLKCTASVTKTTMRSTILKLVAVDLFA